MAMVTPDGRWRVDEVDGAVEVWEHLPGGEPRLRMRSDHPKVIEAWLRDKGVFDQLVDEDDPDCE